MEPNFKKAPFEKISANLASLISQFLDFKDLLNLSIVSTRIRKIFFDSYYSWESILKNNNLPETILSQIKSRDHIIQLLKQQFIKADNYYLKINIKGKNWIIYEASEIDYDWKGSNYWPLKPHKDSWFGEKPIPHLQDVCWFRIYGNFLIPKGKYSLNIRILADKNFDLQNSSYTLSKDNESIPMIKFVFNSEIQNELKQQNKFVLLKLGEFDISNEMENEVKISLRSQEANGNWKHGFWCDAVVFIPI